MTFLKVTLIASPVSSSWTDVGLAVDADVGLAMEALVTGVAGREQPGVVPAVDGDALPGGEELGQVLAALFDCGDEHR